MKQKLMDNPLTPLLIVFSIVTICLGLTSPSFSGVETPASKSLAVRLQEDPRAYQHGIDFLPLPNGNYYVVWASSGNPPTGPDHDGNWTHDIYYSLIDPSNPVIHPTPLISNPEAQEPSSAAISSDGNMMVTMEDGWNTANEVAQRYGVYDVNLNPALPYPQMAYDGGHSGHVAAVGSRFVIFFSDGWVEGGGVDNLGSGDDVIAHVYSATGVLEGSFDIAVGHITRDWWPVVDGSETRAALVWQRFVAGETHSDLMLSILDIPGGDLVVDAMQLEEAVKYYTYGVAYLPSVDRFLIVGTYHNGGGFAYLLNQDGHIVAAHTSLPAIVRESRPIVLDNGGEVTIAQPTDPTGIEILSISSSEITLRYTVADDYVWEYSGTAGIFANAATVYLISTSPAGLVEKVFHLPQVLYLPIIMR